MHGLGRKLRGESGQAAVLIAILCGLMIVVVAMTSNMGKVVTEKIAMQNAVDLAVYSAAASQAGHLNKMRDYNQDAWKVAYEIRELMDTDIPPNPIFHAPTADGPQCSALAQLPIGLDAPLADGLIKAADGLMIYNKAMIMKENFKGYQAAKDAAKEAANKNYKGAGDHLTPLHPTGFFSGTGMMKLSDEQIEVSYHGWCVPYPPVPPFIRATFVHNETITSWQFKDDVGSVMYAAKIDAAPASPFMDVGQYFTPTSCRFGTLKGGRCSLQVYAVAQVYHGKLGSILNGNGGTTDEKNPMKPWDNLHGMPSTQNDGKALLNPHKVKNGSYQDYKVRLIGVFENQAKLIGNGTVVKSQINPTYASKIQH